MDCWPLPDWDEETLADQVRRIGGGLPRLDLCVLPFSRGLGTDRHTAIRRLVHAVLIAKHLREPLGAAANAGSRAGVVAVTRLDGALGYAGSAAIWRRR